MDVSELQAGTNEAWDEYVSHTQGAQPFHLSGWRAVMQQSFDFPSWYLVAREGDQIEGVLPLFKVASRLVGTSVTSLPGGICTENPAAAAALLGRAKEIARAAKAACLIIRDSRRRWGAEADWCDDCSAAVRELPADSEILHQQLKRQIRQHIRRAEVEGVQVDIGPKYVDEFYSVFGALMHEKGVPVFGRRFFDAIAQDLAGHFVIAVARSEGQVLGAILHFTLRDTMFAIWGGTPSRHLEFRPNHALWWEGMRYAIDHGYRYLDMGRSQRGSGSETFKKRWGCSTHPVYDLCFLVRRQAVFGSPAGRGGGFKYRFFTRAWRYLPRPIVQYLGPKLRRHIPFG
jgi:FemAB-related protein (PEP-CTERM system-associated)